MDAGEVGAGAGGIGAVGAGAGDVGDVGDVGAGDVGAGIGVGGVGAGADTFLPQALLTPAPGNRIVFSIDFPAQASQDSLNARLGKTIVVFNLCDFQTIFVNFRDADVCHRLAIFSFLVDVGWL